jgi:hypothetical protein
VTGFGADGWFDGGGRFHPMYYDRDSQPCSQQFWISKLRDLDYKRVAYTVIGEMYVSTVWLGLNHSFVDGPPEIFETMVFGGELDQEQWRYSTIEQARAGHEDVVTIVRLELELGTHQ